MTVGLSVTQVSGLQFIDGFNTIYQVFTRLLISCETSVAGQSWENEAFLSHEEEEEKRRLKKIEIVFFDS